MNPDCGMQFVLIIPYGPVVFSTLLHMLNVSVSHRLSSLIVSVVDASFIGSGYFIDWGG